MENIVQQYEFLVKKEIGKRIKSFSDAEDLVQEVWIKVFLKWHTYDVTKGAVATWLINISKNTAIDFGRKKKLSVSHIDNIVEPSVNMDFSWENKAIVANAISELPSKNQKIINSYFFDRKSHKEIAKEMGWNGNRSGVEIKRSCLKLKTHLNRNFKKQDLID